MLTFRTPDTGVEVSTTFVSPRRRAYHGWNALYQSCVRTAGHQSPGPSVPGYAGDGGFLYRRAGYEAGQDEHSTSTPLRHLKVGILTLLHASADFNNRSRWQVGVKKVEMENHFLPRVGMKCRYLLENGDTRIRSSSYSFHPERIEFSETDEREKSIRHYILERIDDNRSKISIDVYIEKTILQPLLFKLAKKKQMEEEMNESLENLESLVKEIKLLEQAG